VPPREGQPSGGRFRRSVSVEPLYDNADGTLQRIIMTTEVSDLPACAKRCKCVEE
jgi:arabinoxylan arabinofuranohydrolase